MREYLEEPKRNALELVLNQFLQTRDMEQILDDIVNIMEENCIGRILK
jgi:hypothetical protein